ncbi:MAG TPA: SUMF1/EgtB/PvdO family nonheme iron enzyme [Saprospiraceae bacterium]|nr:SUMF1/EgtB/PvdO family nonheme iron enzyme [Saprospiraceae bacterium]HPG08177.1 SUMF1/EgtB/PvdO family nonheme iron enzyme [Saprospiraceae bacterium]HRV84557.1 SUMF1/EgtB/PvdO family nonheme iron enzyme [Saprospiraceae bacterium]
MRNFMVFGVCLLLSAVVLQSCGKKETGQLVGVLDRPKWKGINPFGMQYIKSGVFHIGGNDQDIFNSFVQRPRQVSIVGFFMDETEITNNEYRQFVNYVRDSTAHTILGDFIQDDYGNESIDWELPIDYADETLDEMYVSEDDQIFGKREFDNTNLRYAWTEVDWVKAAHSPKTPRSQLVRKFEVPIYPDTLVWIRDFAYSYNDPLARNYFWHPAYDDYPVVGVNWQMAQAFCDWRTKMWNRYRPDERHSEGFRLPTEYEWEYAARGGHDLSSYPWGGYYLRNAKGCLLANFKPGRGNYADDGAQYTTRVDYYFPNDYGLYQMAGNVSEWTVSAYYDNANNIIHDLNPDVKYYAQQDDPDVLKRKVIRGGSWKDIGYYLQCGVRDWEYQDSTKSYIGFRCVITNLGRTLTE